MKNSSNEPIDFALALVQHAARLDLPTVSRSDLIDCSSCWRTSMSKLILTFQGRFRWVEVAQDCILVLLVFIVNVIGS